MLSINAFNALLKTLEEPPSHCIFILATTEPEKLPATILSRCQRYHFKRISTENIMERMQWICRDGQFEVDDEALRLIAVSADGAMRDALSILDQCLSITQQQRITKEHVKKMLGITDQTLVDGIADAVFRRDANEALRKLDQAYSYGKDMGLLVSQLIETFRDMLVFHITQEDEMVKVLKEDPFGLKEKMQKEDYDRVGRIIELLTERESKMKYTTLPKVLMEVTLVKLITEVGGKGPVGPAEKNPPRSIPSAEPRAQASPKTPPKAPPASTNRKENPSALQAQELVETIGRQKRILGMSLRTANAVVKEQTVVFTYETAHKFHYDQAMKEAAWIQKTAKDLWGEGAKVELLLEEEKQENVAEKWAHEIFDPDKIQVK
ncbi:MAG TPA: hypothetical protein DHN33_12185 [Eubacteriaceae bacterium]|nr:hypothetical protein [Eubacteriaceae bacterium]